MMALLGVMAQSDNNKDDDASQLRKSQHSFKVVISLPDALFVFASLLTPAIESTSSKLHPFIITTIIIVVGLSSERLKSAEGRDLSRLRSHIRDSRRTKFRWGVPELNKDLTGVDSSSQSAFEPFQRSSSGQWFENPQLAPFSFPMTQSDVNSKLPDSTTEEEERQPIEAPLVVIPRPSTTRSFTVTRMKPYMDVPLPMCAASFYIGESPVAEIMESCESIKRLNSYLKERRDDVSAGIPGKFLHAVMGQDVLDVGSFAFTIMYAYYLHKSSSNEEFCTVPVINMKRAERNSHGTIKWLISSCQIDEASLIFIDEIDLSCYDLFGSLTLVLLSGQRMSTKQEDAVVDIMYCRKGDSEYPWLKNVTLAEVINRNHRTIDMDSNFNIAFRDSGTLVSRINLISSSSDKR